VLRGASCCTLGVAVLITACHSAPPHAAASLHVEAPPLAPLEYVPAAGLRWLIVAHPARILADPTLAAAVGELLPPDRIDAFATATGVDPRAVSESVIAGYDLGTLYVTALAAGDGGHARARFEARLSSGAVVKHPRPALYRIAGTRDRTPQALVSVNDQLLAFAVGDLTLARVAEAYAEHRLKSPVALRGAALSTLPSIDPPLAALYAPGPFTGAWRRAAAGLLGDALAVVVAVHAAQPGTLAFEIIATGDWPDAGTDSRMAAAWTELTTSSTGRLLGLDEAKNLKSVAHLHELTWSGDLPLAPVVAGLRAATIANVPEIFGLRAGDAAGPPDKP
jgi:hypothetical protein